MTDKQEQEFKQVFDEKLKEFYLKGMANGYTTACMQILAKMNKGETKDAIKKHLKQVIKSKKILERNNVDAES